MPYNPFSISASLVRGAYGYIAGAGEPIARDRPALTSAPSPTDPRNSGKGTSAIHNLQETPLRPIPPEPPKPSPPTIGASSPLATSSAARSISGALTSDGSLTHKAGIAGNYSHTNSASTGTRPGPFVIPTQTDASDYGDVQINDAPELPAIPWTDYLTPPESPPEDANIGQSSVPNRT
ncbi:hypothetical protein BCR34DRAFT_597725 [Clohesyomyces aquaticus]|uniref:Uncharacterized protein n=1 Tax=Clohesyomyces aquaticus TaxID=1231657 RepID=A0A1Y2A1R0_9PLEO|nr:hypothetical protein BCR34DRAFT_597725 [Clohesyomyces aquaticus]